MKLFDICSKKFAFIESSKYIVLENIRFTERPHAHDICHAAVFKIPCACMATFLLSNTVSFHVFI